MASVIKKKTEQYFDLKTDFVTDNKAELSCVGFIYFILFSHPVVSVIYDF